MLAPRAPAVLRIDGVQASTSMSDSSNLQSKDIPADAAYKAIDKNGSLYSSFNQVAPVMEVALFCVDHTLTGIGHSQQLSMGLAGRARQITKQA